MLHNLRFALREIARAPGFAALACITLAVGIGLSAGMFAALQSTLLKPLPYARPGRLMVLHAKDTSYAQWLRWRELDRDLQFGNYSLTTLDERPPAIWVIRVAAGGGNIRETLRGKEMLRNTSGSV